MDLALDDPQRFICHKTQPTNHPTKQLIDIAVPIDNDISIPEYHRISIIKSRK